MDSAGLDSFGAEAIVAGFGVQVLEFSCTAERPLHFPPRPGATPGTTLKGAFAAGVRSAVCRKASTGAPVCPGSREGVACQLPAECPAPWLLGPYSRVFQRTFTRPVLLLSPELEALSPTRHFRLWATLWGSRAVGFRDQVVGAVHAMGEKGLNSGGERVRFVVESVGGEPHARTLAERSLPWLGMPRVLVELATPYVFSAPSSGDSSTVPVEGANFSLREVLGNSAYGLIRWGTEDAGSPLALEERLALARQTRAAVVEAMEGLRIERDDLAMTDMGQRWSKSEGCWYHIRGAVGLVELSGDLAPLVPWLVALALGGGGEKRSAGFGVVRLWWGLH